MGGERSGNRRAVIAAAFGRERARLDLGRQVAFLERQEPASVKHDVGVGNAAVGRRAGQPAAETAD